MCSSLWARTDGSARFGAGQPAYITGRGDLGSARGRRAARGAGGQPPPARGPTSDAPFWASDIILASPYARSHGRWRAFGCWPAHFFTGWGGIWVGTRAGGPRAAARAPPPAAPPPTAPTGLQILSLRRRTRAHTDGGARLGADQPLYLRVGAIWGGAGACGPLGGVAAPPTRGPTSGGNLWTGQWIHMQVLVCSYGRLRAFWCRPARRGDGGGAGPAAGPAAAAHSSVRPRPP